MIPFYAEELGNINIVRATILAEPEYDVAKQLQVVDNQLILDPETKIDLSTVGLSISSQDWIVSRVDQPTDGLVPWEVKLSQCRQAQQPRSQQTEVKEWWSTSVLKELSEFQCKVCAQSLFLKDKEYKLKDLPSEHWYELVECWICHETKPEEHQARMRPILARPTVLLVGSTYFLLHPDDMIANSIQMDKVVADRLNVSTYKTKDFKKVGDAIDIIVLADTKIQDKLHDNYKQFVGMKNRPTNYYRVIQFFIYTYY